MFTRFRKVICVAGLALLIGLPAVEASTFQMRRGIALGDPFAGWGPKKPGMTFGDPQVLVQYNVLSHIKAAGFDMVRLPVTPRPLLELDGEKRAAAIAEVEAGIRLIVASGLKVLVDLHVGGGGQPWQNSGLTRGLDDPNFLRYLDVTEAMGRMIAGFDPAQVAFELFNEPPHPCKWTNRPDWPVFQEMLYKRVRAAAPRTTLLLSGACFGNWDGLVALDPKPYDANTLYSFHLYHPHIFTHQGTLNQYDPGHYVTQLPWPPSSAAETKAVLDRALKAIAAAPIAEDQRKAVSDMANAYLGGYTTEKVGPPAIAMRVKAVRDWAVRNQIDPARIVVGEFGVTKTMKGVTGPAPADRIRWFRETRTAFEAAGFGWIAWNYHYQGGLISGEMWGPFDPEIMQALGMKPGQ